MVQNFTDAKEKGLIYLLSINTLKYLNVVYVKSNNHNILLCYKTLQLQQVMVYVTSCLAYDCRCVVCLELTP